MSPCLASGAIVLCGGKSSRMGREKATLPMGPEPMLSRVVRLLAETVAAESIVCVASATQTLPPLPAGVQIARDVHPDCGPLAGLATGLRALPATVDAAFVCGCDVPLLLPGFVERMFALLGDHQVAVVDDGARLHPLGGVYLFDVLAAAEILLAAGERSVVALVEACDATRIRPEQLQDVDPDLRSLAACNTPDDYTRALSQANLPG